MRGAFAQTRHLKSLGPSPCIYPLHSAAILLQYTTVSGSHSETTTFKVEANSKQQHTLRSVSLLCCSSAGLWWTSEWAVQLLRMHELDGSPWCRVWKTFATNPECLTRELSCHVVRIMKLSFGPSSSSLPFAKTPNEMPPKRRTKRCQLPARKNAKYPHR